MNFRSGRSAIIGVSAVLILAGVTGCGGSDEPDGPLSKDEFIAQADEICATVDSEIESLNGQFSEAYSSGDFEKAGEVLGEVNEKLASSLDQIEDLEPPAGDQADIDAYIALGREQVKIGDRLTEAASGGDTQVIQAEIGSLDPLEQKGAMLGDAYGFKDCGSGGDS